MGIGVEAVSPEWREEEACSEDCSGLLDASEGSAMGAMLDSRAIQVQFQWASATGLTHSDYAMQL